MWLLFFSQLNQPCGHPPERILKFTSPPTRVTFMTNYQVSQTTVPVLVLGPEIIPKEDRKTQLQKDSSYMVVSTHNAICLPCIINFCYCYVVSLCPRTKIQPEIVCNCCHLYLYPYAGPSPSLWSKDMLSKNDNSEFRQRLSLTRITRMVTPDNIKSKTLPNEFVARIKEIHQFVSIDFL